MSIDSNGVVTNGMLARYDAGIKDIIAIRTAEKNPVRYKVSKTTSTGSSTYSFYKKDENDTQFVVDPASDAITVQDSIDPTGKDPVNGTAVAGELASKLTTANINSIIGYTPMDSSLKGAANGVASLDGLGQVPTSQLPLADTYSATGTKPVTGTAVAAALATLPEPMVFKGTVGTGGTVTSLPTAATSNKGHTYKAITANVTSGSKIGDTFISNGSEWVIIPSGDEPDGTVTQVGINASSGSHLSASGTVNSSGNLTVGVESGYQIPTSSDVSQITTNKTNILYGLDKVGTNCAGIDNATFTAVTNDRYLVIPCGNTLTGNIHIHLDSITSNDTNATTCAYLLNYANGSSSNLGQFDRGVIINKDIDIGDSILASINIYPSNSYSNSEADTFVLTNFMVTSKAIWDQFPTFTPAALPNYDLTYLQAEDRAALAEEIDAGAKNKFNLADATITTGNASYTISGNSITVTSSGTWAAAYTPITLPAGDYVLDLDVTTRTSTTTNPKITIYTNTQLMDHVGSLDIKATGHYTLSFRSTGSTLYLTWYVNQSGTSSSTNTLTVTNMLVATKAAFGVSPKFVPYTKSNSQLTTELGSVKTVLEAIL